MTKLLTLSLKLSSALLKKKFSLAICIQDIFYFGDDLYFMTTGKEWTLDGLPVGFPLSLQWQTGALPTLLPHSICLAPASSYSHSGTRCKNVSTPSLEDETGTLTRGSNFSVEYHDISLGRAESCSDCFTLSRKPLWCTQKVTAWRH